MGREKSSNGVAVFALIVALGAVGLGVYQVFFANQAPKVLIATNPDQETVPNYNWNYIPDLSISYSTQAGDVVLLEYTCNAMFNIVGAISDMMICFVLDGSILSTESYFYVYGDSTEDSQDIYESVIIRHYMTDLAAGSHNVSIAVRMGDSSSSSYVENSVLKVEIY